MSPSLLTFGIRVCDWVAGVEIKFMSAMDNAEHRSESVIVPPNDDKVHTYRLDWLSSIDQYSVQIDGIMHHTGSILEDFDNFFQIDPAATLDPPPNWDDRPYFHDEELLKKIEEVDKYIPDPEEQIPENTQISDFKPNLIVNPEYERLFAEYEIKNANPNFHGKWQQQTVKTVEGDWRKAGEFSEYIGAIGILMDIETESIFVDNIQLNRMD